MDNITVQRTGTNFIIKDVIVTARSHNCIVAYVIGPIQDLRVDFEFHPGEDGVAVVVNPSRQRQCLQLFHRVGEQTRVLIELHHGDVGRQHVCNKLRGLARVVGALQQVVFLRVIQQVAFEDSDWRVITLPTASIT